MTRRTWIRPEAAAEIQAAFRWYENQRSGLGSEFERALDAAIQSVRRDPERNAYVHKPIRRALLRRFPYGLFYIEEPGSLTILACFHTRRDPARWPTTE